MCELLKAERLRIPRRRHVFIVPPSVERLTAMTDQQMQQLKAAADNFIRARDALRADIDEHGHIQSARHQGEMIETDPSMANRRYQLIANLNAAAHQLIIITLEMINTPMERAS